MLPKNKNGIEFYMKGRRKDNRGGLHLYTHYISLDYIQLTPMTIAKGIILVINNVK